MGSGSEETPYSEVLKSQLSKKMFKEGSQVKEKIGGDYLKDIARHDVQMEMNSSVVNRELKHRVMEKQRGAAQAKAHVRSLDGITTGMVAAQKAGVRRDLRQAQSASSFYMQSAGNAQAGLSAAMQAEQVKAQAEWEAKNRKKQFAIDAVGAGIGYGLNKYADYKKEKDGTPQAVTDQEDKNHMEEIDRATGGHGRTLLGWGN